MSRAELGTGPPTRIVFASNTHDFLVRLFAAAPRRRRAAPRPDQRRRIPQRPAPVRALGGRGAGGRHPRRRRAVRQLLGALPRSSPSRAATTLSWSARCCSAAADLRSDRKRLRLSRGPTAPGSSSTAITPSWRSKSVFGSQLLSPPSTSAAAINMRWRARAWPSCTARPASGPRPPITGWYAEFGDLTRRRAARSATRQDAMRFMGATFDPSASTGSMPSNGCSAKRPDHRRDQRPCRRAAGQLLDATRRHRLGEAELLNPLDGGPHARFLAFRSPECRALECRADGAGLHHRRPRRCPAHRPRPLP